MPRVAGVCGSPPSPLPFRGKQTFVPPLPRALLPPRHARTHPEGHALCRATHAVASSAHGHPPPMERAYETGKDGTEENPRECLCLKALPEKSKRLSFCQNVKCCMRESRICGRKGRHWKIRDSHTLEPGQLVSETRILLDRCTRVEIPVRRGK